MLCRFVKFIVITLVVAGFMAPGQAARAQSGDNLYKDKVLTIVIAFGPGGGYHLYSNTLARFMKQYIPNTPPIVLQFMPGAGGLKAANYFYNVTPKNGTYMALLSQTASLFQALKRGDKSIRYDASKYNYIGRLVPMDAAHMFYKTVPSTNLATLKGSDGKIIACTAGKASQGYINARALSVAAGFNVKILSGYQGSKRQNLGMQQGECNYQPGAWNSWKARRADWLKQGLIKPVALTGLERIKDLPNVPTIVELAKGKDKKAIMRFVAGYAAVGRAYTMPPKVPKKYVSALRTAFNKTVKDEGFLAFTKKRNMLLGPATGEYVQKVVDDIVNAPDDIVNKTKKMLGYK